MCLKFKFDLKTVTASHGCTCCLVATRRLVFDLHVSFEEKSCLFAELYFLFHIASIMMSVHDPHFPKAKEEGWWIVLGETEHAELLDIKRLGKFKCRRRTSLAFSALEFPCYEVYTIFLISDSYFGLDQRYLFQLEFISPHHES